MQRTLRKILERLLYEPKTPALYKEIDFKFAQKYQEAKKNTQSPEYEDIYKQDRHYLISQFINPNGNIAECGVWQGRSAYFISLYLEELGFKEKFYLFDSFKGAPPEEITYNSLSIVQENLKRFKFIEYKDGWIPDRFEEVKSLSFSLVNIDLAGYDTVTHSLEFFYPRSKIIFLNYGYLHLPEVKVAVDNFMRNRKDTFITFPTSGAVIIR